MSSIFLSPKKYIKLYFLGAATSNLSESKSETCSFEEIDYLIVRVKRSLEEKDRRATKENWNKLERKIPGVFPMLSRQEEEHFFEVFQDLTEIFLKISDSEMARKTIRCNFNLIKHINQAERLKKLDNLGTSMRLIAEQESSSRFTAEYELMDRILDQMHLVCDEDMEVKCQWISRFCLSYGSCCIAAGSFKKAIEINEKAIFMIQFVFGEEYGRNKYLNRCYHNIGVSYQKLGKAKESKDAFGKAVEFEKQFNAFKSSMPNEERRVASTFQEDPKKKINLFS